MEFFITCVKRNINVILNVVALSRCFLTSSWSRLPSWCSHSFTLFKWKFVNQYRQLKICSFFQLETQWFLLNYTIHFRKCQERLVFCINNSCLFECSCLGECWYNFLEIVEIWKKKLIQSVKKFVERRIFFLLLIKIIE